MSYKGQVLEIPLGVDGFTGSRNVAQINPGQLIIATNIQLAISTLAKEGGMAQFGDTQFPGLVGLGGWDWWPTATTQRGIIFWNDTFTSTGAIAKDTGGGTYSVSLKTGLNRTGVNPVFVEGGQEASAKPKKLFIFSAGNPVQVLAGDGATTTNIATPPADWTGANQPITGVIAGQRLMAAGNPNDPHRWYMSKPDNHEDFSASAGLPIYPGDGTGIVAGCMFKGLLVTFKAPRGIYITDTANPDVTAWQTRRITSAIGGCSPNGHAILDNDVIFFDNVGSFQMLSAVFEFGDVASRNISQLWQLDAWARDNLNLAALGTVQAVYYTAKREAHFSVPGVGTTTPTLRLVVDFNRLGAIGEGGNPAPIPRVHPSNRERLGGLWLRRDSTNIPRIMTTMFMGGFGQRIYTLDQPQAVIANSTGSVGYIAQFQTPHLDFHEIDPALAGRRKVGHFLELVHEDRSGTLNVEILWDERRQETVAFTMGGGGGAVLGSTFVLGTAVLGGKKGLRFSRKRISGSGVRFSMRGTAAGLTDDFSLAHAYLYAEVGANKERA